LYLVTSDINAGGAMFSTSHPLDVGTEVQLESVLSPISLREIESDRALIRVRGYVLRNNDNGMAICFENRHEISPIPD
jgi:hypothetical protein